MTDQNLHVTAPMPNAPRPIPRLVAVVRGGFADELSRKVRGLKCPHNSWCGSGATCSYCTALNDVLDILETYR